MQFLTTPARSLHLVSLYDRKEALGNFATGALLLMEQAAIAVFHEIAALAALPCASHCRQR